MSTRFIASVAFVAAIIAPAIARADEWTFTQEFQGAESTSIRVVEPEGYKVTVNGHTDAAPAVFALDNADNYYVVHLESPDGATWEKKIEVRAYRQTVLRVRHVKGDAPGPATNARAFVGVVANLNHTCRKADQRTAIRLDFVRDTVVKSVTLEVRTRQDVELPEGDYNVRFYRPMNGAWAFSESQAFSVKKDGWVLTASCQ